MANTDHQIGTFQFVTFDGDPPDQIKQSVEVLTRPGVPGTAFWRTGQRGVPFSLVSKVDQTNFDLCAVTYGEYCQLVGAGLQEFHWNATDFGVLLNIKVMVIDVVKVRAVAIKTAVGKKIGSQANAWLEARWTLVPVYVGS